MKLKVIGSSSKGNGYILETESEALIIEAGLPIKAAKLALNFRIGKAAGCLISHRHNDHAGHIQDYTDALIQCYGPSDVFSYFKPRNMCAANAVEPMRGFLVGGFRVLPIPVRHDVECYSYVIEHDEMGRLFFATDTMMLGFVLPTVEHVMIEANYSDAILARNIANGIVPSSQKERLLHSHMEIETTKKILRKADLSKTKEVILIHLSDNNSDEGLFTAEVMRETGLPVYCADSGFQLELSK